MTKINNKDKKKNKDENLEIPEELPVLVLRDISVFPYMIVPLYVGREKSKNAVDLGLKENRMVLLLTQKEASVEDPTKEELYTHGTVSVILRMLQIPDGRMRVLVQGIARAQVKIFKEEEDLIKAEIKPIVDKEPKRVTLKNKALMKNTREKFEQVGKLSKVLPQEIVVIAQNIAEPGKLADVIASHLDLKVEDYQKILQESHPVKRLERVHELLNYELDILQMQNRINTKTQDEIDKIQKEYFLRQQLKAIKKELGEDSEDDEEISNYLDKLEEQSLSEEAEEEVKKNIDRLSKMHPDSAESTVIRNYLDWMLDLPWDKTGKDNLNLVRAEKVLNKDHFGLEDVKERILEYLSVKKLAPNSQGPILCFLGPPGVGKTSLGRSIASALNKKFVRISLGGVRDEAEIRGHRRTYIGAMPGKIIQEIKKAGTNNPVFMMDEVDKIGSDFRGDPSSALLEVLDPQQNDSFSDHYLGVPFDLSKVLFITTANQIEPIQPAFRDRMEIITIHGYTLEEKIEIAKRHLLPRQIKENGLKKSDISFSTPSISNIVSLYTREAGVRNLEREIGKVCRKIAHKVAMSDEENKNKYKITPKNLEEYLGPPKIFKDQLLKKDSLGVATGMAWTPYGGDLLFIEIKLLAGKGKLTLTGSLGNVMKESATAALTFIKSKAKLLKIDEKKFENTDIHIHVPEGATPKDGPSAGIALCTALFSAFKDVKVKKGVSMTGEITLRGKVLPVGGIKEKVLAATRAGIEEIILPVENSKDLKGIKKDCLEKVKIHFVEKIEDAVNKALVKKIF